MLVVSTGRSTNRFDSREGGGFFLRRLERRGRLLALAVVGDVGRAGAGRYAVVVIGGSGERPLDRIGEGLATAAGEGGRKTQN